MSTRVPSAVHRQHAGMPALWPETVRIWRELVLDNPMLGEAHREMRRLLRTARAMGRGRMVAIGLILILYVWLIYEACVNSSTGVGEDGASLVCLYVELVIVTLVIPGSTYGAISGERERSTWDALVLTRLTPAQIVAGKLLWRLRTFACVSAFTLPLLIPCVFSDLRRFFPSCGVVILSQVLIGCWVLLLATFTLWVSSITARSIASLAVTGVTLLMYLLMIPGLNAALSATIGAYPYETASWFIAGLNPFAELATLFDTHRVWFYPADSLPMSFWTASGTYAVAISVFLALTYRRIARLGEPSMK